MAQPRIIVHRTPERREAVNAIAAYLKASGFSLKTPGDTEVIDYALASALREIERGKRMNIGDRIQVLPRIAYQTLSAGAIIDPAIKHQLDGYQTTIRAIYREVMEDEHGNEVIETIIETATGELVAPHQVTLI